jgi:hypothetical protein
MSTAHRFAPSARALTALAVGAALLITGLPSEAKATDHRVELDGTVGYRFGGALRAEVEDSAGKTTDGKFTADASLAYGGIAAFKIQSNSGIFLSYSRQDTTFRFRPEAYDLDPSEAKGSIEYFQFGGNLERTVGRVSPYFGVSIGATRIASQDTGTAAGRFSLVFDGGLRIELLPFLHLRLLGRLPLTFSSGNMYCYSAIGCTVVVSASPFVQGEFQGGLGLQF